LLKINRNTINSHYKHFRELIIQQSFEENARDFGVCKLDERSFGVKRVQGKRGRGAAGKTPVSRTVQEKGHLSFRKRSWKDLRFPQMVGRPMMGSL
jgi:hypothetical protein